MHGVGRVPLVALLVVAVLAGGILGVAAMHPATADATDDSDVSAVDATPAIWDDSTSDSMDRRSDGPSADRSAATTTESRTAGAVESDPSAGIASEPATRPLTGGVDADLQSRDDSEDGIVLTQRFRRLPEEPGRVAVTYNYSIPDRVVSLRTAVPGRGNVTGTDGFRPVNETIYDWDEATTGPTITYRLDVNETGSGDHVAANGTHLFADVGEWSLFRRPPTSTSWEFRGREPIAFDRRTATTGPGAAGDWLVYMGEGRLYTRGSDEGRFRLVVPAAANTSETPDDVLDALERAAADVDVGDAEETTFAVAAPTGSVPWAVRGLSVEGTDVWVRDRERLDTTDNIWIHEYVHTLQEYEPTAATRWTREGFATYYAAVQAMRHQDVTFAEFAADLAEEEPADDVTLADPDTWGNRTAYDRGALVAGQLDRRIRAATDGERTLDAVFAGMNEHADRVNATAFYGLVDEAIGNSSDQAVRTAVGSDRPVPMWNRSQHVGAFGGMPPRIEVGQPRENASPYRVQGPYRNGSIDAQSPTVVTGETIVVDAEVRNVGGTAGYYDVDLTVDRRRVDTVDGEIPSGDDRIVSLSATFDDPGEYTIAVGDDAETVNVVPPASPTLVDFNLTRTALQQYESATVEVTLRNDLTIPARRNVTVQRGSHDVVTRPVYVGPLETTNATFEIQFPTSGTTSVTVDDLDDIEVDVEPRERPTTAEGTAGNATTAPPTGPSSALGPGLGFVAGLVVVLATLLVARYRR